MDTDRWEERRQRWEQKQDARRARWEDRMSRHHYRSGTHGLFFGAIVVAIGFLLLLDNLGFVRFHDIWQYWPVLLVAYGVSRIVDSRTPSGYVWGGVLALIGAFLLLDTLDIIVFNFAVVWPLILIAFGISVLVRALERNRFPPGAPLSASPVVGTTAIFSETKSGSEAQDFHGGEATAVFGAARFDLRNASMTVDEARIDVNVVFGEVEVRVPETWNVVCRAGVVFAGVNDKTIHPKADPNVKTPRLVITGGVVFGAITLRN
jgi:predicted membrane protein